MHHALQRVISCLCFTALVVTAALLEPRSSCHGAETRTGTRSDELSTNQLQKHAERSNEYKFSFSGWSIYIDVDFDDPESGIKPAGIVNSAVNYIKTKCPGAIRVPGHMTVIHDVKHPLNHGLTGLYGVITDNNIGPFETQIDLTPATINSETYPGWAISGPAWKFGDYEPYEMKFLQLQISPQSGGGALLKVYSAARAVFSAGDTVAEGAFSPHFSLAYLPINDTCFTADDTLRLFEELPGLLSLTVPVRYLSIWNTTGPPGQWKVLHRVNLTGS